MCSLASERRPKFANFHESWALLFVLALDRLANTFPFPDGEKTVKSLQLVFSRFVDLTVRLILSTRVCPSAHSKTWLLDDTSDCIPFKTVPAISKRVDLRIFARQRPERRRAHQVRPFTFFGIIEGVRSCSSQVYWLRCLRIRVRSHWSLSAKMFLSFFSRSSRDHGVVAAALLYSG
jgi:hypothetical protein